MYVPTSVWTQERLGRLPDSTRRSPAAFAFGKSHRFSQGAVAGQPGPGRYEMGDTWQKGRFGAVFESTKLSPAKAKVGTEPRFSKGKDNAMPEGSPGPGTYKI